MLTRCVKAYTKCLSLFPTISAQFTQMSSTAKDCKKTIKLLIFGVQGLSKLSMPVWLKSSSLVLVVIGSMPMHICNHFHERLANSAKIPTFYALWCRFA